MNKIKLTILFLLLATLLSPAAWAESGAIIAMQTVPEKVILADNSMMKNPCHAKGMAMNPCHMKNPCHAKGKAMNPCHMKNPCHAKGKAMNPCHMKNPCHAKGKAMNPCHM